MSFNADGADRLIGGRYALEFLIARGGMGEVWRARHVELKTNVAIKFLSAAFVRGTATTKRFLGEAKIAARLNTKYAVRVFDFGVTETGQPYLVMEMVEGETLAERVARTGALDARTALRFVTQCARALSRAHELGIVHCDLKPENVLVTREDGVDLAKILDFGVAKLVVDLDAEAARTDGEGLALTLSRSGRVFGTPYFMAPEQVQNDEPLGPAVDIWALGILAYNCVTGALPFVGRTLPELFSSILEQRHVPARRVRPELPESFEQWFETACAAHATDRFPSAAAAAAALGPALGFQEVFDDVSMPIGKPSASVMPVSIRPAEAARTIPIALVESRPPPSSRHADAAPASRSAASLAREQHAVERARALERTRGYRLAIFAFIAGALTSLAVERVGLWLGTLGAP